MGGNGVFSGRVLNGEGIFLSTVILFGHCFARSVLRGSVILQVAYDHLRSPFSLEIVFGKETSTELVIIGEDGIATSVCEQTVFGTIKDLAILPWNDKVYAKTCNVSIVGYILLIFICQRGPFLLTSIF
ncbi:hypothetical protein HRI_000783300 [Hibiscus trionum]|uniref:Uncharacterized protein n=1 Tax=Hibiscus trionum TaxID=183268 RepID=A0A9W7H880_HIBTR|nr:hypothetical protein HRI_000783300 [Hibiscus trionum]